MYYIAVLTTNEADTCPLVFARGSCKNVQQALHKLRNSLSRYYPSICWTVDVATGLSPRRLQTLQVLACEKSSENKLDGSSRLNKMVRPSPQLNWSSLLLIGRCHMTHVHIIGIDLGKNSFHLVGRDRNGHQLSRLKLLEFLSTQEPVSIVMESCGGAHWLARKCQDFGHTPKLLHLNM